MIERNAEDCNGEGMRSIESLLISTSSFRQADHASVMRSCSIRFEVIQSYQTRIRRSRDMEVEKIRALLMSLCLERL